MIVDLNDVDSNPFNDRRFDVCICGAGVAGITLALKLSPKLSVLLLEAGSYEYTADSQTVYQGTTIGREYFDLRLTRLRYFGGTSNHWSGWCRPLDSHDFKQKSYSNYSSWPIEHDDLAPYLEETKTILDIATATQEGLSGPEETVTKAISNSQDFDSFEFLFSAPTRFGKKYRDDLEQMPNLTCYLNANLVNITLNENQPNVEQIEVRNYAGQSFSINARSFILAAGGIENPRILLNCNDQQKNGLGNENDLVGRFFTEHPHHFVGSFILKDDIKQMITQDGANASQTTRFFTPTPQLMQQEKILNFGLRFEPFEPSFNATYREQLKSIICGSSLAQDAIEMVRGEGVACYRVGDGQLRVAAEQAPNPDSRVMLGAETDRFGQRRTALDWRLSEIDKRTLRSAAIRFGTLFADLNLGRVRVADWLLSDDSHLHFPGFGQDEEVGGHHHMCTTRMGHSPADGVVDSNQRVFGIDNLYLAGSSVFSTAGHANPTFTIVQMTLRLADHLNQVLVN